LDLVLDIDPRGDPAMAPAVAILQGLGTPGEPAVLAVGPAETEFQLLRLAVVGPTSGAAKTRHIIGGQLGLRASPPRPLEIEAREFAPLAVREGWDAPAGAVRTSAGTESASSRSQH
jgi:hypothetical protein